VWIVDNTTHVIISLLRVPRTHKLAAVVMMMWTIAKAATQHMPPELMDG
jgi:hypothetical protein